MEELITRYEALFDKMKNSADPAKMMVFGDAERWAFKSLAKSHPDMAKTWLTRLEAIDWDNYLSDGEYAEITAKFVNQNGSSGPMWSVNELETAVNNFGGNICDNPHYNKYALFATMNMIASDHWETLSSFVPEADLPNVVYRLAVEKLCDADRKHFVRPYFGL